MQKYYITTAIAYTSSNPHIGISYEIVLADALARYKRLQGYDVFFQTGTDDHGKKIEDKAKEANMDPKQYVDIMASKIKDVCDLLNTSYDKFMRTTDEHHEKQVDKIFKKFLDNGDIYKGHYEGHYCKACESFFTESQLVDGKCPDCGGNVELAKEETYFFNLAKYADRLIEFYNEHPEFIQPESRKNEMINNFIKPGLQDLSVSRTSFTWGIPLSFDPKHVVYVWIDALSNYITGLGFDIDGNHGELYKKYWPADLHVIGKDIIRFHTIYWPIMLMALDIPLPKTVYGHPWLLMDGQKMSKSKGNTIYAEDLAKYFPIDAIRYYVLQEMSYGNDGNITWEAVIERINSNLANILGNLLNRSISMTNKYFNGTVSNKNVNSEFDANLVELRNALEKNVTAKMDEYKISDALDEIFNFLRRCNKYIDETTPWALGKDESKKDLLETVLWQLLESLRVVGILIEPFMIDTSKSILNQIGTTQFGFETLTTPQNQFSVTDKPTILFERYDVEKTLALIKEEFEKEDNPFKDEISYDDFAKLDIRVGKVLECKKHEKADSLLLFKIDLGVKQVQIVSGIANYYKPEELVGKQVLVVCNLAPRKIRGEISEGMILSSEKDGKLSVTTVEKEMENGSQVS